MQLSVFECRRLQKAGLAEINAKVKLSGMTVRTRNLVLKALRTGFIPTSRWRGSGFLADRLLGLAAVPYMHAQYGRVFWSEELEWRIPGLREQLLEIKTADTTATQVRGAYPYDKKISTHRGGECSLVFYTLELSHHIPPLLADYVHSLEYRSAIDPLIKLVEEGGEINVTVQ